MSVAISRVLMLIHREYSRLHQGSLAVFRSLTFIIDIVGGVVPAINAQPPPVTTFVVQHGVIEQVRVNNFQPSRNV